MDNAVTQQPAKSKGGRPLGAMSKLAKDAREQAVRTGELPHEILLRMARGEPIRTYYDTGNVDQTGEPVFAAKYVCLDLEGMRDAAKAAAPYFAPKISTVEVIAGVSDADLDRIIEGAAAEAGVSLGLDGEGAPHEAAPAAAGRRRVAVGDGA